MGIEIKKKWNGNLSVETDYGGGDLDHKSVYENRTKLKNYMQETGRDSLKGNDYFDVMEQIKSEKRKKEEEERERFREWEREHSSRRW